MKFSDIMECARRRVTECGHQHVHDLCLEIEYEFLRRGIEIGSSVIGLDTPERPLIGFIIDITYHPTIGFHALFVSADNEQSNNRYINRETPFEICLLN